MCLIYMVELMSKDGSKVEKNHDVVGLDFEDPLLLSKKNEVPKLWPTSLGFEGEAYKALTSDDQKVVDTYIKKYVPVETDLWPTSLGFEPELFKEEKQKVEPDGAM